MHGVLTFLFIQGLLDVHRPILVDLVGHNPCMHVNESISLTYDDFGALLALEAESLLGHLECATCAGDHGVAGVAQLQLDRGQQLGVLMGRGRITIGV